MTSEKRKQLRTEGVHGCEKDLQIMNQIVKGEVGFRTKRGPPEITGTTVR